MIDSVLEGRLYSVHDDKEKKRCPNCNSLRTHKHGFVKSKIKTSRGLVSRKTQRYYCKSCEKSFTSLGINPRRKTSKELKSKAVRDYVLTKNSLQEVADRYDIAKSSILNWLETISTTYPKLEEIPDDQASGLIQIDGKEITIKGEKRTILVASDARSKLPIHYDVYLSEGRDSATEFFVKVKELYPVEVKGITTDFGRGKCFVNVVKEVLPGVPHQICLVHFMRYIWLFLPRTKRSEFYWRNTVLKKVIKRIIFANNREESLSWLAKLIYLIPFFRASYHDRFIKSTIKNYSLLTKHFEYEFLPTNTNGIENFNRQLERKIKNLDGFKSEDNVSYFLRIWFANHKIKNAKTNS